ncbi:MAG TPA: ABC transporter substrate-binding protein, partial [Candidatus Limnocylindrales bacterium]|nr:ABC transporter substrate-binding protein [Candidatus Limnocylindrales bacterium]
TSSPSGSTVAGTGPRKPTGTLTVATPDIGNALYIPSRLDTPAGNTALATFGESLIERKVDRSLGPRLARAWSVSADGLTYTFDLRTDVKWDDGTPFTSDDVAFTMKGIIQPGSTNGRFAQFRGLIDSIETPTADRVIMHLKNPDVSVLYQLAAPGPATQAMFSKKYITQVGEDAAALKPVGTGPWKFVEYRPGELIRCTAVEGQWRVTPQFQELVIRQVPEESTRVAMLLRGEADIATVSIQSTKQLTDAGMNLFLQPTAYSLIISLQGQYLPSRPGFKKDVPWAADPADPVAWERARKVREALDIAIDRKTIVSTVLSGQGAVAAMPYAVPASVFADPSYAPIEFNPTRAKQLLADAGYGSGFDMPFLLVEASGRPLAPQVGQAVAQYWQAIGVRIKQSNADFTATVRPGTVARTLAGTAFTFGLLVYDEPFAGLIGNGVSTGDALIGVEYPPLDALVAKAAATIDVDARRKVQVDIGKMMLDQHFMIGIVWVHGLVAGGKRVTTLPQVLGVSTIHNYEYAAGPK